MRILTIVNSLLIVMIFIGCGASLPKKIDFNSDECYQESLCRYFSSYSDKPVDCSAVATRCSDSNKEKQMLKRYEYCKKEINRWKNKDAQSCWDKLNSK